MKSLPRNLEDIVKETMSSLEGTAHSYAHVDRVAKIAAILAEEEKADRELVHTATLLHDIGYAIGEPHNETGARFARQILEQSTSIPKRARKHSNLGIIGSLGSNTNCVFERTFIVPLQCPDEAGYP